MELTELERAQLAAIRDDAFGDEYRIDAVRPPGSKDRVGLWRKKLGALQDAWIALDFDTQQTIVAELAERHANSDGPVADIFDVVTDVMNDARRNSGSPVKTPGFGEAAMFLWRIWCRDRPGVVFVDEDARKEIGSVLADLYRLNSAVAGRRLQYWINRRYQTHGDVSGR